MSVGAVVVGGVVVVDVVVAAPAGALVVVEMEEEEVAPVATGAVVVAAVVPPGAVGAMKGDVSPLSEARLVVGVLAKLVQLRAEFHVCSAVAAGAPVRGCGSPAKMVAGRKVAAVILRPTAVMMREPLDVSGALLS